MTEKRYLNDFWDLKDSLGIGFAADHLAEMALSVSPPFTIAMTGKWGSGKTSILRRAFATLGGNPICNRSNPINRDATELDVDQKKSWDECAFHSDKRKPVLNWSETKGKVSLARIAEGSFCVWFSPWQYGAEQNPMVPLIWEIHHQFSVCKKFAGVERYGGQAALATIKEIALAVGDLFPTKWLTRGVEKAGKEAQKAWDQASGGDLLRPSDGQRFQMMFEDAVYILLDAFNNQGPNDGGRLVIFVDDLDRCEEGVIVSLLESIKLYLNCRHCVFVLGVDDGALLKALKNTWRTRSDDDNREYLEKLVQAQIPVPRPSKKKVLALLKEQLRSCFKEPEALAEELERLLEPNPRKLKNFLNSLCSTWTLLEPALDEPPAQIQKPGQLEACFVLCHYLRLFHRDLWRLIERQPDLIKVLKNVFAGDATAKDFPEHADLEQHLAYHLFEKSFCHVLKRRHNEKVGHFHDRPLHEALSDLQERLDRKRSDNAFVRWFNLAFDGVDELPLSFFELRDREQQ